MVKIKMGHKRISTVEETKQENDFKRKRNIPKKAQVERPNPPSKNEKLYPYEA